MTHRATRLAVAATLLTALTACTTSLPTEPAPRPGLSVQVAPQPDVQHFLQRPQPGASPTEIVQGFLRANVGFAGDDDVARTFLTAELASAWVPTRSVLVLDGTPQFTASGPGDVTVAAKVSGRIGEDGRLEERSAETSQVFELTQVDGEWRIATFPDDFGLWLSSADLERAFRATRIYYLNPHLDYFVPEVRWLARGEGLPTAVARAQLAPVPTHLEGAVRTGGAPDVNLAVGAVPVDPRSQLATVNLHGPGLGEDDERLGDLRAQLGHALLGLSGVTSVELRVGGRDLPDDSGSVNAATDLGFDDVVRDTERGLLRIGEGFILIDPGRYDLRNLGVSVAREVELPRLGMGWNGVAASAALDEMAAISTDRTRLWRWTPTTEHIHEGIGDQLTAPSYDPHGALWLAGVSRSQDHPRVWVIEGKAVAAVARPLEVSWLDDGQRIDTLRISPDGTRALLVVRDGEEETRQRLLVAGIVRDSQGRPTALASPLDVAPTLIHVASARWATVSEIVVSGQRVEDQRPVPFSVPLGGWLSELGDQAGLVDVFAVPTGEEVKLVVLTEDGRLHTREGSTLWFAARNGDELILPGS